MSFYPKAAVRRNDTIDFLRGVSIIVMILTHATSYFLSDPIASRVWNWSHFAVPIFVFCSAYLFFQKYISIPINIAGYLKQRIRRLLVPYYMFLGIFLLYVWFYSKIPNSLYLIQSILIIGGVDVSWLVLLFMQMAVIFPIVLYAYNKYSVIFRMYFGLSLVSAIVLLFYVPPVNYRYFMWLPWSVVIYFSMVYIRLENYKKKLLVLCLSLSLVFVVLYLLFPLYRHTQGLFQNKYPPNIYYLSYGMSLGILFSFISRFIMKSPILSRICSFFSVYSYQIFFIHFALLTLLFNSMHVYIFSWYSLFLVLLFTTVFIQIILNYLLKFILPHALTN